MNNFKPSPRPTANPLLAENLTLNFEEVKVTYRDDKHDKWIDVLSTDWG